MTNTIFVLDSQDYLSMVRTVVSVHDTLEGAKQAAEIDVVRRLRAKPDSTLRWEDDPSTGKSYAEGGLVDCNYTVTAWFVQQDELVVSPKE